MTISEYATLAVVGQAYFGYYDLSSGQYINVDFIEPNRHSRIAFKVGDTGSRFRDSVSVDLHNTYHSHKAYTRNDHGRSSFKIFHNENSNEFDVQSASSSQILGRYRDGGFKIFPDGSGIKVRDDATKNSVIMRISGL